MDVLVMDVGCGCGCGCGRGCWVSPNLESEEILGNLNLEAILSAVWPTATQQQPADSQRLINADLSQPLVLRFFTFVSDQMRSLSVMGKMSYFGAALGLNWSIGAFYLECRDSHPLKRRVHP